MHCQRGFISGGKWRDASAEAWLTATVSAPLAQTNLLRFTSESERVSFSVEVQDSHKSNNKSNYNNNKKSYMYFSAPG